MTEVRRYHIEETEGAGEDELGGDHTSLEKGPRSAEGQEGHEVHPLVLSLLYQGVDPAVVSLHPRKVKNTAYKAILLFSNVLPSQRTQMSNHPRSEAWDPSDCLKEDTPNKKMNVMDTEHLYIFTWSGRPSRQKCRASSDSCIRTSRQTQTSSHSRSHKLRGRQSPWASCG